MTTYTVTPELVTPLHKSFLRFFRLSPKRTEIKIVLVYSHFKVGEIIHIGGKEEFAKIIKREYEKW